MPHRDEPPPFPPRPQMAPRPRDREEATLLQHGLLAPEDADWATDVPELPQAYEDDLPPQIPGGTGAKVSLQALAEGEPRENTREQMRRTQNNLERRVPVDPRARPSLLPSGAVPPLPVPAAPRAVDPGLMRPVQPAPVQQAPEPRESSDVIQMFSASAPMAPQARTAPPPQPARGQLVRKGPPAPVAAPVQPSAPARPAPSGPQVLPLSLERVAALTAEHRARLQTLDVYARTLDMAAGVLGTIALAMLIATLVSILLGNAGGLVSAGTGLLVGFLALGVTLVMVACAAGLRQVSHQSAQLASLIESLGPPRS